MYVHKNARMTIHGRLVLVAGVREQGWRVEAAAPAAGVSVRRCVQVAGASSGRRRARLP
jgi:hypothetical protein